MDAFVESPMLRAFLGPAGSALGTDPAALAHRLGPVRFRLGIITGDRSLNPIASWIIPGPDDGKVAVDRARLDGASFLVLPATHTFIMNRRDVADEIVHFLHRGRFRGEIEGRRLSRRPRTARRGGSAGAPPGTLRRAPRG